MDPHINGTQHQALVHPYMGYVGMIVMGSAAQLLRIPVQVQRLGPISKAGE